MPIVRMDNEDKRRKNSLDNASVCARNSLHVVCNEILMVVLDLLSAGPVEIELVQSFVRAVAIVGTGIECDLGRRRRDILFTVLVLGVFTSCFEDLDFTSEGIDVIASPDLTGGENSVSRIKEQMGYYALVSSSHWRCRDSGEGKSSKGKQCREMHFDWLDGGGL